MLMKLHKFIERGNVLKNNSLPIHIAGICICIINMIRIALNLFYYMVDLLGGFL